MVPKRTVTVPTSGSSGVEKGTSKLTTADTSATRVPPLKSLAELWWLRREAEKKAASGEVFHSTEKGRQYALDLFGIDISPAKNRRRQSDDDGDELLEEDAGFIFFPGASALNGGNATPGTGL